ncbi:oligoribonuclease [Arthrobacter sp. MYb227]|uniref:oligoribonuclease n=1 Tax=Arthrobacter sp. MYb227 TaxID=1848601 RepID=UPI000CFB33E1|nr:oligoribonuclease [Arthrobacter sp. MYb227]PQZ87335.1 oligoribonuclease [Arthrobacter sp. MYb227]
MPITNEKIVWIDCEMTGLSLETDALIEVAVLVTDAELNILGAGVSVVIKPPVAAIEQMGDFVRNMHVVSGLLPELDAGMSMQEATSIVMDYIRSYAPEANKALLAGNSVGTDKNFLARDMPEVIEHLHYRILDVSTIKELARRWYPKAFFNAPDKTGNHRALGDIRDSIDELKYYRATVMVPAPGPDSASAKAAAAAISAESRAD